MRRPCILRLQRWLSNRHTCRLGLVVTVTIIRTLAIMAGVGGTGTTAIGTTGIMGMAGTIEEGMGTGTVTGKGGSIRAVVHRSQKAGTEVPAFLLHT